MVLSSNHAITSIKIKLTDDNHDWLYMWELSTQSYKLICSICNAVKYVGYSEAYEHFPYGCCDEDHTLSGGNMMAVASYGDKDYYKCKFCRYVAPFSQIVDQNYTVSNFSDEFHKITNNVEGLRYTFYEEHFSDTFVSYDYSSHTKLCECGEYIVEEHNFRYVSCLSNDYHRCVCDCGYETTGFHVVNPTTAKRAPCILCKATITIGNTTILPWGDNEEDELN
jgi:hypothetical protein